MIEINPVFYPYYAQLDSRLKELYVEALPYIHDGETSYKPKVSANYDEVYKVFYALYKDRPEYFWFRGCATTYSSDGIVSKIEPTYYPDLLENFREKSDEVNKIINSYLKEFGNKTVLQQERLAHDRMVKETYYQHSPHEQTVYGILVERKGVCGGYARAFQLLMQKFGVPCYYCLGKTTSSNKDSNGLHAWNIIKLGNDYYNMDITWDDDNDNIIDDHASYKYYNCTDAFISKNHKRVDESKVLPACKGTKYSFDNINGGVSAELERIYQSKVTSKKVVHNKEEYIKKIAPFVANTKKGKFKMSFVITDGQINKKSLIWFSKEMKNKAYTGTYSVEASCLKYSDNLRRFELIVTYE